MEAATSAIDADTVADTDIVSSATFGEEKRVLSLFITLLRQAPPSSKAYDSHVIRPSDTHSLPVLCSKPHLS